MATPTQYMSAIGALEMIFRHFRVLCRDELASLWVWLREGPQLLHGDHEVHSDSVLVSHQRVCH